jgi:TIR domain
VDSELNIHTFGRNALIRWSFDILNSLAALAADFCVERGFIMRVFVSWSGERSKAAALGLKSLLEDTFAEGVDVFISDHIDAGEAWARRLESELEQSQFGVLCLTQENFQAPWLLFEAGAISKKFGSARVAPYLIDELPSTADRSPLSQFQHVQANREGTLRLVKSINAVRENPQVNERLERLFNKWWPDFDQTLKALPIPGRQPDTRSEREILETILHKVDILVQAHQDSAGPALRLPSEELAHLVNLRDQPTITYTVRGNLKKELRHLRDLGLIKNKQGPIGELPTTFQLDHYFELSESGLDRLLQSRAPKNSK